MDDVSGVDSCKFSEERRNEISRVNLEKMSAK